MKNKSSEPLTEPEMSTEFKVVMFCAILAAICLLGLVMTLTKIHDIEVEATENAKTIETVAETEVPTPDIAGEAATAIVSLSDIEQPENAYVYVREGRVVQVDFAAELEKLGFTDISSSTTKSGNAIISAKFPQCDTKLELATAQNNEDDGDENTFLVEATAQDPGEFPVALTRECQISIGKLMFGDESSALLPSMLYKDASGVIITERQLNCIRWLIGNDIPKDARFIEDGVSYLSKNTS